MDRRKTNKVGCKGYNIDTKDIVRLYQEDGLTMKEIGKYFGISHWTVLDRLKKAGVRKNTRHTINHSSFDLFTPESCYWAGFIAADGCIVPSKQQTEIELQRKDSTHLKKLCKYAKRDTKLWFRERNRDGKIFKYASVSLVSSKIIIKLNDNFNITPNKSLTLLPPTKVPDNLRKHFIRGYMDGDGSIGWHKHNRKRRLSVCSGSQNILQWIKSTVEEEVSGVGNPSIIKRPNTNTYSLEYMGNQTIDILNWMYSGSGINTRLLRKYRKKENMKNI